MPTKKQLSTLASQPTVCAIYARVSTEDQAEKQTVQAQLTFLRKFCDLHSITIADEYVDDGISGTTLLATRFDGQRLLQDARAGHFQTVLVYRIDRLGRSLKALVDAHDALAEYDVTLRSATEPFDTSSPIGRFIFQFLSSLAELEIATINERMRSGRLRKAGQGLVVGAGTAPYGYRFKTAEQGGYKRTIGLEFDPATKPIVEEIFASIRTMSTVQIARALNERNVKSPAGTTWCHPTVTSIVKSLTYAGTWRYDRKAGDEAIEVEVPALITMAEHEAILELLSKRRRTRMSRSTGDPFALRGMLSCSVCGGPLRTRVNTKGYRYYRCGRRCIPDLPALAVEAEWRRILAATLLNQEALDRYAVTKRESVEADLEQWKASVKHAKREVERQRQRLSLMLDKMLDASSPEMAKAAEAKAKEIEQEINRQKAIATTPAPVAPVPVDFEAWRASATWITDDADAEALYTEEIDPWPVRLAERGWSMQHAAWMRSFIAAVDARGEVALAGKEDGVKLGKSHHFLIQWSADIELASVSQGNSIQIGKPNDTRNRLRLLADGTITPAPLPMAAD